MTVSSAKTATINLTDEVVIKTLNVGAIDTTVNVAAKTEITTLTASGDVVVKGTGDVEVKDSSNAALVDASGLVGKLTLVSGLNDDFEALAGSAGSEITIATTNDIAAVTGGAGADVVDATSITNGTIVFVGGAGNDKLIVDTSSAGATIVFDGGVGNDTLVLKNGADLTDATTSVTLSGVETITVDGAQADVKASLVSGKTFTITGDGYANSELVINGTASDDTINLSGLTASSAAGVGGIKITVDGGNGNDTITLSNNAVETVVVGVKGSAGVDVITNFSSADFISFHNATTVKNLVSGTDAVAFAKGTAAGQFATLDDVLATFESGAGKANTLASNSVAFFQFDGKTYALIDGGTAGYDVAEDALVQLVGVDVATLGAGNFIA